MLQVQAQKPSEQTSLPFDRKHPTTTQACLMSFLDLPLEIRNMIYTRALDCTILLDDVDECELAVYLWNEMHLPAMTMLNQQTQSESLSLFLGRYRFVANFGCVDSPVIHKANELWMKRAASLSSVRFLEIQAYICHNNICVVSEAAGLEVFCVRIDITSEDVWFHLIEDDDVYIGDSVQIHSTVPEGILDTMMPIISQLVDDNDAGCLCLDNLEDIRAWLEQEEHDKKRLYRVPRGLHTVGESARLTRSCLSLVSRKRGRKVSLTL